MIDLKVLLKYIKFQLQKYFQLFLAIFILQILFTVILIRDHTSFNGIYFLGNITVTIVTLVVLGYQYRKKSVDHYYSLPITKKQLFFVNQIVAFIVIIIPLLTSIILIILNIKTSYSVFGLFTLLCSITTTFLLFSLITTLANTHFDSIVLMVSYFMIPSFAIKSIMEFLSSSLNGFPFGYSHTVKVIRFITFYVDPSIRLDIDQKMYYVLWLLLVMTLTIILTYYFVGKRKPEGVGGSFSHPMLFTFIKGSVVWIYLLNAYSSLYDVIVYRNLISSLIFPVAVGLIFYVIFTLIQKKTIEIIIPSIIKYFVLVALFLLSMHYYNHHFKWYFVNKEIENTELIKSASITILPGKENDYILSIIDKNTHESIVQYYNKKEIEVIQTIHKQIITESKRYNQDGYVVNLGFELQGLVPFRRNYFVPKHKIQKFVEPLYTEGSFQNTLNQFVQMDVEYELYDAKTDDKYDIKLNGKEILLKIKNQINQKKFFNESNGVYIEIYSVRIYFNLN